MLLIIVSNKGSPQTCYCISLLANCQVYRLLQIGVCYLSNKACLKKECVAFSGAKLCMGKSQKKAKHIEMMVAKNVITREWSFLLLQRRPPQLVQCVKYTVYYCRSTVACWVHFIDDLWHKITSLYTISAISLRIT